MSELETLVFNLMLWALAFLIYKYTPWHKFVDRIAPKDLYESNDK